MLCSLAVVDRPFDREGGVSKYRACRDHLGQVGVFVVRSGDGGKGTTGNKEQSSMQSGPSSLFHLLACHVEAHVYPVRRHLWQPLSTSAKAKQAQSAHDDRSFHLFKDIQWDSQA